MNKEVYELFEDFEKLKKKEDKARYLREMGNEFPAFKDVIRGCFDPRLVFVLPEGKPPYRPNRPESVPSTIHKLHRQFGDFVRGIRSQEMGRLKVENRFIQLLESVHAEDALIVLKMKEKKPPAKGLTKALVQEVFPEMFPSDDEEE